MLTTQAHFDHLGALAAIKKETGAQFWIDAADAQVAKDGGSSDYELSRLGVSFAPIAPDRLLKDKDVIALGDTRLVLLHHPGHTKGSCSYLLDVKDSSRTYKVLIANIPTIITERRFAEVKEYPSIREDYAYTLNAMKHLEFDIWVASHASQFNLHKKHIPGDPYNPWYLQTGKDMIRLWKMYIRYTEKSKDFLNSFAAFIHFFNTPISPAVF